MGFEFLSHSKRLMMKKELMIMKLTLMNMCQTRISTYSDSSTTGNFRVRSILFQRSNYNLSVYLRGHKTGTSFAMRKLLILLISISFLFQTTNAQKRSFPGFYVTPAEDTVHGVFPDYANWNKNPSSVSFIVKNSGSPITLTPDNAKTLVLEGEEEYLGYSGPRMVNPYIDRLILSNRFSTTLSDSFTQVKTFLRLIARTTAADLYVLTDDTRTNFFYKIPGQSVIELRFKKTFDGDVLRAHPDYKLQLQELFATAIMEKRMTDRLQKLGYTESELSRFFLDLFPAPIGYKHNEKIAGRWMLSAGPGFLKVKEKPYEAAGRTDKLIGVSVSPVVSIGYWLPVERKFGRFFIYPQLKIYSYKAKYEDGSQSTTYQGKLMLALPVSGGVNWVNTEGIKLYSYVGFGPVVQAGGKETRQNGSMTSTRSLRGLVFEGDLALGLALKDKFYFTGIYKVPGRIGFSAYYDPYLSGFQLLAGVKL
jgi:hypothetical protein